MPYTVVYTDPALADLEHIRAHISQDNPAIASRIAIQIVATCDRLEAFPYRGRPGLVLGTRELTTLKPYIVVYRIDTPLGLVEILRVWHGAQHRLPAGFLP